MVICGFGGRSIFRRWLKLDNGRTFPYFMSSLLIQGSCLGLIYLPFNLRPLSKADQRQFSALGLLQNPTTCAGPLSPVLFPCCWGFGCWFCCCCCWVFCWVFGYHLVFRALGAWGCWKVVRGWGRGCCCFAGGFWGFGLGLEGLMEGVSFGCGG